MLGINGEEEEQPARRRAGFKSVKDALGADFQENPQRRMIAMAMRIMRTW